MASRGISRTELKDGVSHEGFLRHKRFRWLKITLGLSLLSLLVYAFTDVQPRHNGGSWLGYTLGTIGALLIRSEEHTSELQSLMRNSYAVFCLKNKIKHKLITKTPSHAINNSDQQDKQN